MKISTKTLTKGEGELFFDKFMYSSIENFVKKNNYDMKEYLKDHAKDHANQYIEPYAYSIFVADDKEINHGFNKPNPLLEMSHSDFDRYISRVVTDNVNFIELSTNDLIEKRNEYLEKVKKSKRVKENIIFDEFLELDDREHTSYVKDTLLNKELDEFQNISSILSYIEDVRTISNIPFDSFAMRLALDGELISDTVYFDLSRLDEKILTFIEITDKKKNFVYTLQFSETENLFKFSFTQHKDYPYDRVLVFIINMIVVLNTVINMLYYSKRKVIIKEKKVLPDTIKSTKYKEPKAHVERSNIYISTSKDPATTEEVRLRRRLLTKYFKANWNRRGHYRTLQSGKVIFIKEAHCERNPELLKRRLLTPESDGTNTYIL